MSIKTIIMIITVCDINDGAIVKIITKVININKKITTRKRKNCNRQFFPLK